MIAANETVAEYAEACEYPFVYRVHEKPAEDKLSVLLALLKGLGINVKRSAEIHNSVLQDALMQAEKTPYFNLVNDVMLRTMQKAKYSDENIGHFGLASKCYCHFTSPIRRYPDLTVHRVLKTAISGKMTEKALNAYKEMVLTRLSSRVCAKKSPTRRNVKRTTLKMRLRSKYRGAKFQSRYFRCYGTRNFRGTPEHGGRFYFGRQTRRIF